MRHSKHGKKGTVKKTHTMPDGTAMPGKSHGDYMEKSPAVKKGQK